jgi:hypothetical protein
MSDHEIKASPLDLPATPSNAVPDAIPQERFTGDVLHGHGPRRGNLERLLRYWRPIMRKEGGFRRCRVILADHPELFPLNNMCAWLHHETTGLWPNEGCHHPGMKNCRKKLKKGINGTLWNDSQFNNRLGQIRNVTGGKKSLMGIEDTPYVDNVVTHEDIKHALLVMSDFVQMEPHFAQHIGEDDNWEFIGEDEAGESVSMPYVRDPYADCC